MAKNVVDYKVTVDLIDRKGDNDRFECMSEITLGWIANKIMEAILSIADDVDFIEDETSLEDGLELNFVASEFISPGKRAEFDINNINILIPGLRVRSSYSEALSASAVA